MSEESDYRVALDIYRGPLDLLLYLIRENEVEITDIPIATITDQFMRHLELIRMIDPNAAGDFLVMASALMEIKSRTLLPRPETEEGEEDFDDPRIELIRQLMEYKRFKEAAAQLAEREEEQALRFPRGLRQSFRRLDDGQEDRELEDVSIWDIMGAFDKVMRETLRFQPATIVDRDVPLRQHIESLLRMLRVQGTVTFLNVFESCEDRVEAVGAFLAVLEMTRRCILGVEQTGDRSEIYIRLVDEGPVAQLLEEVSEEVDLSARKPSNGEEGEAAPAVPESVAQNPDAAEPPPTPGPRTPPDAEVAQVEGEHVHVDVRFDDEDDEIDEELKAIRDIEIRDVDLGKELAADQRPSADPAQEEAAATTQEESVRPSQASDETPEADRDQDQAAPTAPEEPIRPPETPAGTPVDNDAPAEDEERP